MGPAAYLGLDGLVRSPALSLGEDTRLLEKRRKEEHGLPLPGPMSAAP